MYAKWNFNAKSEVAKHSNFTQITVGVNLHIEGWSDATTATSLRAIFAVALHLFVQCSQELDIIISALKW